MNILIKNATVITGDKSNEVINNCAIGISNGVISFVENTGSEKISIFKSDRVIDAKKKLVMPGLINMHTHVPMTILRNYADDMGLNDWLFKHIIPVENEFTTWEVKWGTTLGLVELIKSGVTAFNDMYLQTDAMLGSIYESGMRGVIGGLPFKRIGTKFTEDTNVIKEHIKKVNNSGNDLVKEYISIHSLYNNGEKDIKESLELAKELNTSIHIHVSEGYEEEMNIREKYGKTSIQVLNHWGVLDVPVIAAHCVYVTEEDMDIMKEKGVTPVHCPSSNLKLGNGFAPIPKMLEKGVNVCIGTDGPSSNNNMDLLEEMHLASLIHKGYHKNPQVVTAKEIINLATVNGAKALNLSNTVGMIKEGMSADMVIIDIDNPHCTPLNNPISMVAYSMQGGDVETVIVKGKVIMENKEVLTIDEEKAKFEVNKIAKKLL